MKTIMVANQKGGVGKSLISDELAFHFERDNIPTSFYDLDDQGGTIHETSAKPDAEVQIVDTPGALVDNLDKYLQETDLLIIPTRPSARDIPPLERIIDIAKANNTKIYVVLNAQNRFTPSCDFESWFVNTHGDLPYDKLPETVQFIKAGAKQSSIEDVDPKCSGALAMEKIYRTCRMVLDI